MWQQRNIAARILNGSLGLSRGVLGSSVLNLPTQKQGHLFLLDPVASKVHFFPTHAINDL